MENNKALVNLFNKLKITPKSYFLYIEALTHASYHNDKHLVRNLPYEDIYIKADKNGFIYFYPWFNKKLKNVTLY